MRNPQCVKFVVEMSNLIAFMASFFHVVNPQVRTNQLKIKIFVVQITQFASVEKPKDCKDFVVFYLAYSS